MDLNRFPRRKYTAHPTPIEPLPNLTRVLCGGDDNAAEDPPSIRLWIKRDDQTGLTGGGNKTRKLEFVMADALQQGADTILTCGAVQSNHCRLTLAACRKEGMQCWPCSRLLINSLLYFLSWTLQQPQSTVHTPTQDFHWHRHQSLLGEIVR